MIGIAGAGAVGAHYGAMLQAAGRQARLLARGEHLRAMRERGLVHETGGVRRVLEVTASDDATVLNGCDVVLLACKMTGLEAMLEALRPHVRHDALVMTLQNGVEAPEMAAKALPGRAIAAGTAFIGVRLAAPGHVLHTAAGGARAALWRDGPGAGRLSTLVAELASAGVPARIEQDARRMLWRKLLWNCGFNALTAIVRRHARDVAADTEMRGLAQETMRETIAVARAEGVTLESSDVRKHVEVTLAMGPVKTSMWQDIERGCRTEVDWLNGFVTRRARAHGLDAPVNRMLTALVHAIETTGGSGCGAPGGNGGEVRG